MGGGRGVERERDVMVRGGVNYEMLKKGVDGKGGKDYLSEGGCW